MGIAHSEAGNSRICRGQYCVITHTAAAEELVKNDVTGPCETDDVCLTGTNVHQLSLREGDVFCLFKPEK